MSVLYSTFTFFGKKLTLKIFELGLMSVQYIYFFREETDLENLCFFISYYSVKGEYII
jgi:hypothetical protein